MAMGRRFNSRPSQLYLTAVDCLEKLREQEPSRVLNAAAEVISKFWIEVCKDVWGKKSTGYPHVTRLWRKSEPIPEVNFPAADHPDIWLEDGKPSLYTSQPYGISWQSIQEMVDFCRLYGLEMQIDARFSYHFPGQTLMIMVRKASTFRKE